VLLFCGRLVTVSFYCLSLNLVEYSCRPGRSVVPGVGLLRERISPVLEGSREYAGCITAAPVKTVQFWGLLHGVSGLYGCPSSGVRLRPDGRAEENVLILLCFCTFDWVNGNTMFVCILDVYTESDVASSKTICSRS
jgi:hypothetical protein